MAGGRYEHNGGVAYFVALASAWLLVSAATALRPGRRGIFAALAYPVGWAAGELAGQAITIEAALVALLAWWGWPHTAWLSLTVAVIASVVVAANLALVVVSLRARTVVRRAMATSPRRPLEVGRPRDDRFGSWWRTAAQIPWHPRWLRVVSDVPYGPLARHRLDVWRTSTTPRGAPVILYLHGGAWTFGDKREQGRPMLHEFVARGWIAVAPNYRLAPHHPWPAQIEDAAAVLAWVKREIASYGGDPDRVVVAGGSAGGHLAALVGLAGEDPAWRPRGVGVDRAELSVRGVISLYGVLEMTGDEDYWRGLGRGIRRLLEHRVVQLPYEGHEDLYRALSPIARIHRDAPPFLVVQGGNDTLVDVNVARAFVSRFREVALAPIYHVELPLTQHAFDVTASPRTSAMTRAAVAFAESVTPVRVEPPASTRHAYQVPPTTLRVEDGGWRDAREVARERGPLYVVTADNPFSAVVDDGRNAQRERELADLLDARHVSWWASRATAPGGPTEQGAALAGVDLGEARAWARAFEQYALYEVRADAVVVRRTRDGAVLTDGVARERRAVPPW